MERNLQSEARGSERVGQFSLLDTDALEACGNLETPPMRT